LADPREPGERATERLGHERLAARESAVAAFQALPLASRFAVPQGVTPPALAVAMVDGGRVQIPGRRPPLAETAPAKAAAAAATPTAAAAPAPAPEWDEQPAAAGASGHWRQDQGGLLLTMHRAVSAHDPCPEIPQSFLDPLRLARLARELKQAGQATADAGADHAEPEAVGEALRAAAPPEPPEVAQRQVVARLGPWRSFAPLVAQAAWARGPQGAERKASVGGGSANNWRLQRRCFGSSVPVLDFIHALACVFAAAQAGRTFAAGRAG